MSHDTEPIVIDRRHPAWVAAFGHFLDTLDQKTPILAAHAIKWADDAWKQISAADVAERQAYEKWKEGKNAERLAKLGKLAMASYGVSYDSLRSAQKDLLSYTLASHGDDLQKALGAMEPNP